MTLADPLFFRPPRNSGQAAQLGASPQRLQRSPRRAGSRAPQRAQRRAARAVRIRSDTCTTTSIQSIWRTARPSSASSDARCSSRHDSTSSTTPSRSARSSSSCCATQRNCGRSSRRAVAAGAESSLRSSAAQIASRCRARAFTSAARSARARASCSGLRRSRCLLRGRTPRRPRSSGRAVPGHARDALARGRGRARRA